MEAPPGFTKAHTEASAKALRRFHIGGGTAEAPRQLLEAAIRLREGPAEPTMTLTMTRALHQGIQIKKPKAAATLL